MFWLPTNETPAIDLPPASTASRTNAAHAA